MIHFESTRFFSAIFLKESIQNFFENKTFFKKLYGGGFAIQTLHEGITSFIFLKICIRNT